MKDITPIGNRILVELVKVSSTTESGFILAAQEKVDQQKGIVLGKGVGFGDEKDLLACVKEGDTVYFNRYGGEEIKDEKGEVVKKIIDISSVFAVEKN